jgi:hypothetical protein
MAQVTGKVAHGLLETKWAVAPLGELEVSQLTVPSQASVTIALTTKIQIL